MKEEHEKLLQEMFDTSSMQLAEHGMMPPMYFILKDGQFMPMMLAPGTNLTVDQYASTVINAAHTMEADAVVLICEQYMVKRHVADPVLQDLLNGKIKPSEQEDKEEYLTLTYMESDGESRSLIGKVEQSFNGIRFVRESKWVDNAVTNMIQPWT